MRKSSGALFAEEPAGRRAFLKSLMCTGAGAAAGCKFSSATGGRNVGSTVSYVLNGRGKLALAVPGLKESVSVCFASDTHLALHDERDDAYADNYARMAKGPGDAAAFSKMLLKAAEKKADLVALTGDTISFPTLANVEFVAEELGKCGIDWIYTAGNHDWHFEGDAGSDDEQRARWIERRLMPLYGGKVDPLMHSKVVKGVRFVAIDNSTYNISEAQLAFWRSELAKGDPTVLLMHIPLWAEGLDTVFSCGCPKWGAASDPFWKVERREKWAERQSDETFAFREDVLSAPNVVAVLTGHLHCHTCACCRGKHLFTIPSNRDGYHWNVRIGPADET